MNEPEKMEFGENLKSELKYQDIRQEELAYKTGISLNTLYNYIYRKKRMPPADTALKIARTLNVTVEYLLTGKGEIKKRRPNTPEQKKNKSIAQSIWREKKKKEECALYQADERIMKYRQMLEDDDYTKKAIEKSADLIIADGFKINKQNRQLLGVAIYG